MGGNTKMLNLSFTPIVKTLVTTAGLCAGLFAEYKIVQFAVNKAQLYISEKWFKVDKGKQRVEPAEGKGEIEVIDTKEQKVVEDGKLVSQTTSIVQNIGKSLSSLLYGDEGHPPSNNAADGIAGFITGVTAGYGLLPKTEVVGKVGLGGAHEDSDGSTHN